MEVHDRGQIVGEKIHHKKYGLMNDGQLKK